MKKFLLLAALPFLFATYSNAATPKAEAPKLALAHKQTKQRFSGKITGYQTAEHSFSVLKGDRLRINKTGSPNAYFNVWHPKAMKPYLTARPKAINLTVSPPNRANIKCRSI